MRLDGERGATLFTPHPALDVGGASVDGIQRLSRFPSPINYWNENVKEVRKDG